MEKFLQLNLININSSINDTFVIVGIILFLYMSIWSTVAISKKRADLADVAWGLGFILVAWTSFIFGHISLYGVIVNILVTIWGIRLLFHIYFRNQNKEEDFRYQALKKQWKKNLNLHIFFNVFLLQGLILYIVALPLMWIHLHSEKIALSEMTEILGIAIPFWLIGFIIETIADRELALFQKNPSNKGKLLTTGLWSYVRHPNYLGELMQWWAIWLMTLKLPYSCFLIISPLLLTFLIVKVSGIKPLEEKMKNHPDFKAYAKNTPSLVPPSLINGLLYGITWFILISYGAKGLFFIPILAALLCYIAQLSLFIKFDRKSLRLGIPLSIIATVLGFIQEMIFIKYNIVIYPNESMFPPFWIVLLYPLFSLTINCSLAFINKNLGLAFLLGGLGGVFSYISGEMMGAAVLLSPTAYPILFMSWGIFLTILVIVNRKLSLLKDQKTKI